MIIIRFVIFVIILFPNLFPISSYFLPVCCYLVWLTWCTVTSTPDSETTRDPTEEYFSDRGIQVDLGPYHAGIEPYHDLDLPRMSDTDQCSPTGTQDVGETWVPYTAVSILFIVLVQSSVTSWTSHPAQVLAGIKLGDDEDSDPGLCICCRCDLVVIVSYVSYHDYLGLHLGENLSLDLHPYP